MKDRLPYFLTSVLINILLCIGGAWTLLIGIYCMSGAFFSKPSRQDFITGLIICLVTYFAVGLINFVIYKIFNNKLNLERKHFFVPTICVFIAGLIYSIVLFI